MTIYDAAMAILLVLGMVRGVWRGFTWQVASLGSLILGYTSARTISGQVAPYLPGAPEVQRVLAMVVVYIAVSGGIFALAWMVRGTLRRLKFDAYDRHLGMLLGGAEAVGVGLLATLFVVSLAPATREPIFSSPTGRVVSRVMNQLGPVLPAEVRKVLAPHWDGLAPDESLANAADPPAPAPAKDPAPVADPADAPSSLPDVHEADATADNATPAGPDALPPLEPPGGHAAPAKASAPVAGRASGAPGTARLDAALAKSRQVIEQAAAETLDTDPNAKAQDMRQLFQKNKRRIKEAAGAAAGKAEQQVGQVQDRLSWGQQALEQAISDSIAKGQERVEQAISDSIDQQLRRLGGLQPATAPAPASAKGGK